MAATTKTQNDNFEMKPIETFYDENNIPYLYFRIEDELDANGKKVIRGLEAGWHKWSYKRCMTENKKSKAKNNSISANLRNSGFCIIDIDDEDLELTLMEKYGDSHWTESSKKKLPHLYRRIPIEDVKCKNVKETGYDIMYTQAFETIGSEMQNWDGELPIYKSEKKKPIKKEKETKKQYDPSKVSDFDRAILDNIDIKYWNDYDSWFKLIGAIVKEKQNILLADEYSKKAANYGGIETIVAYTSNAMTSDITWGTVMYYSKLSNPDQHQKIINMHRIDIDLTDAGVATMLLKMRPDDFVFQDGILYYCFGSNPFWKYDDEDNGVSDKIQLDLLSFYNEKMLKVRFNLTKIESEILALKSTNINGINSEKINIKESQKDKIRTERDTIEKGEEHAKTNNRIARYVVALKHKLSRQENKIMFDTLRPNVFCFQNCNIDVVTREKVEIYKQDYITKQVGYDFVESSEEECKELEEIIMKILPEEENRMSYMSALWCGMIGKQVEKFVIATGGGRNGKGVINELFAALLTDTYFYTGNVTAITENLKGGANQEVANMDTKRAILFSEPNDSLKLKLGNIKSMTGNTKLNARALYSKKTDVIMQNMTILECNNIPGIEGRIDTSAAERFMIIDFISTFTNDAKMLEMKENCHPLDTRYKSDEFKQKFKCVLFQYLLAFQFTEIYLPTIVRDRTHKYLVGCDDFLTWFNEVYELTESDKDIIIMKQLHEKFRSGHMWESMPKADRRGKWAKTKMVTFIKQNISLGVYFKDRYTKNGKDFTNVLTNYRLRDATIE